MLLRAAKIVARFMCRHLSLLYHSFFYPWLTSFKKGWKTALEPFPDAQWLCFDRYPARVFLSNTLTISMTTLCCPKHPAGCICWQLSLAIRHIFDLSKATGAHKEAVIIWSSMKSHVSMGSAQELFSHTESGLECRHSISETLQAHANPRPWT